MDKADFDQVKRFIFSDIEREIQLARADKAELERIGVNLGGGNFLAALGLFSYTEFGGKLKFNKKNASENFNLFFDELGDKYKSFRQLHDVYNIFRCGLVHEYYVKGNCTIRMLSDNSNSPNPIGINDGGYYVVIYNYSRDLRKAFDALGQHLFGS